MINFDCRYLTLWPNTAVLVTILPLVKEGVLNDGRLAGTPVNSDILGVQNVNDELIQL